MTEQTTNDTTSTAAATAASTSAAADTTAATAASNASDTAKTGDVANTATTTKGADSTSTTQAADPAKKTADTILDDTGADKAAVTPADWPGDWRQKLAGDDKKLLAQLERYTSPVDLAKKIREQDALIAQGKHKVALPKDATAEQIAAYRKENGIPETVDKYDLALPDGLVIGEQDKPIVTNMLTTMHNMNLSNDQVKQVLASYYQQEKEFLTAREADIAKNKTTQEDELRTDWGNEYRTNITTIASLVKTFSEQTRNALVAAIDSDGYPLLNNKSFLKDMAVMARTINPIDTVVSGNGSNQMSSVDDEIKGIEAKMGTKEYYKDEKTQARYRQLVEWRDKQKKVG